MKLKHFLILSAITTLTACVSQVASKPTAVKVHLAPLTTNETPPENYVKNMIEDEELIASFQRIKPIYDKYLGYREIKHFCPADERNEASSSNWYNSICIPKNMKKVAYIMLSTDNLNSGHKNLHIPFLRDFYEGDYHHYEFLKESEKPMALDFFMAHEIGHLYKENTYHYPYIIHLFKLGKGSNSDVVELRDEIYADTLAVTMIKTLYGDTPAVADFIKKVRYFRIYESNQSLNERDPHFIGELYKDGVDLALSFDFSSAGMARLNKTVDELTIKSYRYFNAGYDEKTIIKEAYDLIKNKLVCHIRKSPSKEGCYRSWGVDERLMKMSYPEFKAEYERVYQQYFGQ